MPNEAQMSDRTVNEIDISAVLDALVYLDLSSFPPNATINDIVKAVGKQKSADGTPMIPQNVLDSIHSLGIGNMKMISSSQRDKFPEELLYAATFQDDAGNIYVTFRGTGDGKWVDNADGICHESSQMQREAQRYFDHIVEDLLLDPETGAWDEPGKLIVTGHSKGGNSAQFVTLISEYSYLIDRCYSLDGEGHSEELVKKLMEENPAAFDEAVNKMYSVNGENDFVHDLGIVIIPEDRTFFVKTPNATGFSGYHLVENMIGSEGLTWHREDGTVDFSTPQGSVGKFAKEVSNLLMSMPPEQREDAAVTVMGLLEYYLPYDNETGGYYRVGSGDHKSFTLEEIIGLEGHGLADVLVLLRDTKVGQELLEELLGQYIREKKGFDKVKAILVVAIALVAGVGASYILELSLRIIGVLNDAVDLIVGTFKNLIEGLWKVIQAAKNAILSIGNFLNHHLNPGYIYAKYNPQVKVDTATLKEYAQRLDAVQRRLRNLDDRLDSLYTKVGLLGLWNLICADALTGYSWRLNRCAAYLRNSADAFDNCERRIIAALKG